MVLLCPQTLLGVLRGFVSAAWQLTTTINHEAHDEVEADDVFGSRLVLSFGASECHRNQEVGWVREVLPRSDAISEVPITTINHEVHDEIEADDVFGSLLVLFFGASEFRRNQGGRVCQGGAPSKRRNQRSPNNDD